MTAPQPSDGFRWTQAPWGAALRCEPLAPMAHHVFTTGNLRLVDDLVEWSAVERVMGVAPGGMRLIRQVHGTTVVVSRAGDARSERPTADIIVSDDPSVAVGVRVADCAAVLLADRRTGAVGAAHAGWRGTAAGAGPAAISAMRDAFGCRPEDLVAAIGPCLGPCCGEVGEEVVDAFRAAGHGDGAIDRWFDRQAGRKPYLDLWAANADQLAAAGVPRGQVHVARLCTRSHAGLLHSYRAHGAAAGRMLGAIRALRTASPALS